MLDSLRKAAGTWVAKMLLLLLVVSFAVWGISGQLVNGFGSGAVVTAGGTTVSPMDFRLAYDRQVNVLSQQLGQRITREQATAMGIDEQVLAQLVAGAVLDEQARNLGLGLSKDRLAALTREDPAFAGVDGRFDRQVFDYVLRQVGMTPDDYLRNRQQVAVRQQIVEAVSDGIATPDTFLRAVALYRGEDRTVEFITLPKSLVEPIEEPADAALSTWFEERKQSYGAPEYRKISYVKLEPADIADESAVTDEQARADYDKNKARYTTPETRTIEQIVFKDRTAADNALAAIRGGQSFDQIVTAEGKTPADVLLGTLSKDKVADKAIAEAAFVLQANQVSEVIDGAFGPVLIRVTAITPEVVKPFEEVAAEIRKDLALGEANRVLLDVHDSYEDARAGGESMKEAADKLKLKVVTVEAIDRQALGPDGAIINTLPESRNLLAAAFETEIGVENPPINIGSNGYVFFEVEGITPARERPLDEVRAKVIADWKAAETTLRLTAKGNEYAQKVKDGMTMDQAATELSQEKQTKRGVKREADDADFGRAGVASIYRGGQDSSGVFGAPTDGGQILFKVTEVFEPAGADASAIPEDAQRSFASGLADDLLDQLVAKLQTQYEVTIDRNAMAQALAFQ